MDFIANRRLRMTLLGESGTPLKRNLSPESIDGLRFIPNFSIKESKNDGSQYTKNISKKPEVSKLVCFYALTQNLLTNMRHETLKLMDDQRIMWYNIRAVKTPWMI